MAPGELLKDKEAAANSKHALETHAGSKLLPAQPEAGELRSGNAAAFNKFKAAAKKVLVTNEVMSMLQNCQQELRQVQSDYKERQQSASQADGGAPTKPEGAKSIKARQVQAVAAADAAASYSLRSGEQGRVDPAAGAGAAAAAAGGAGGSQTGQPQKSALPADWGFLKNVDRLHAAPAAAAARTAGEVLARPEQGYLSKDAATKAAHQAWQPEEEAGWRKVLTQKKHRAANKAQIEEAEREAAALFIQANWLLHKHRKEQQRLKEAQLTAWAEEHFARRQAPAAAAGRTHGDSGSDSDSSSSSSSSEQRRRMRVSGAEDFKRPAKPIVQPWSRMVGREVPITIGATTPTATAAAGKGGSRWKGAVSGTLAANKLAALASGAEGTGEEEGADSGSDAAQQQQQQEGEEASGPRKMAAAAAGLLLQEVEVTQVTGGLEGLLPRKSSSVPLGAPMARTSSIAGALASVVGFFRGKSGNGGHSSSRAGSSSGSGGSSQSGAAGGSSGSSKPPPCLTSRLSMDLAAFFGGGGGATKGQLELPISNSMQRAHAHGADAGSKPPVGLARRISMDLTAFFTGHAVVKDGSGDSSHTGPTSAAAAAAGQPPLHPTPPLGRRRSVEFVRNLFRRSSLGVPGTPQQDHPAAAAAVGAGPAAATPGNRTAEASRFVTAESFELNSQLPSPLLMSTCATARTSWSDAEASNASLAARGAAAAAAYLEAATAAATSREAVMSLCAGMGGQGSLLSGVSTAAADAGRSNDACCSLSGGGAGVAAGVAGPAAATAAAEEGTRSSFDHIWSKIQASAPAAGSSSSNRPPDQQPAAAQPQQQQELATAPNGGQGSLPTPTAAAAAAPSAPSSSKRLEPQPPAKPRVVGHGEVSFQPGRPVLVTAADVSSSSFFKPTAAPIKATPAASAKPPAGASGAALAAGSSFFAPSVQLSRPAAVAVNSLLLPPPAGAPAAAAGQSVATGQRGFVSSLSGPASPSTSEGQGSPSPPASPSRQQLPAWGPGAASSSSSKAPQPPKGSAAGSGSIIGSNRPGPRAGVLSRQKGQKSADMAADVAAAVAAGPGPHLTAAAAAAGAEGCAGASGSGLADTAPGVQAAAGRAASAGRSSMSSKLAFARRMAAATASEEDAEPEGAHGLQLQLDGSAKRHSANHHTSSSRSSKEAASTGTAGQAVLQVGGPAVRPLGSASRKSSAELGLLRPTAASAAAASSSSATGRVAWVAEPLGKTFKGPTPSAGTTSSSSSSRVASSGSSSNQPKTLPQLSAPARRAGSVSLVGLVGAAGAGEAVEQQKRPRRNSFSNDGSKPSGGGGGVGGGGGGVGGLGSGLVVSSGGRLRPSSGRLSQL